MHTQISASPTTLDLSAFLARFAEQHGRNLQPRARRQIGELVELLEEFLHERGVAYAARTPGRGVVSRTELFDWLDAFETTELFEAFGDSREQLRVADTAMRALTRQLQRALG